MPWCSITLLYCIHTFPLHSSMGIWRRCAEMHSTSITSNTRGAHFRLSAGKCSRIVCWVCTSPLCDLLKIWASHSMSRTSEWTCWTRYLCPFRAEPKVGTWDFQLYFHGQRFHSDFGGSTQPRDACVDSFWILIVNNSSIHFRIAQEILPSPNKKIRICFGYWPLLVKGYIQDRKDG